MRLKQMMSNRPYLLFIVLTAFFIGNTIVAEFVGLKIFSLEKLFQIDPLNLTIFGVSDLGFNLTAGALLWPVVFVMTDLINEYYGGRMVRLLSYIAVGVILYSFFMVYGAINLPSNDWWQYQSGIDTEVQENSIENMNVAFSKIMGAGLWIIIGSMVAFLVGQIVDVFVFHKIKQVTGEGKLWLRATGSTLISQFIDSYVVLLVAFWIGSDWDLVRVLAIGTVNYIYKFGMAILLTPLIYLAHHFIENFLGDEVAKEMKIEASIQSS